jgi:glycosyltransferase involved in cell wall biosynthesis
MAISGPSMDRLVEQYRLAPPHQVVLVRTGVEVSRFLQPPPPEEVSWFRQAMGLRGRPIIGAIARLSPVKGLDLLLRGVPNLIKNYPNIQVLLVGDGPERATLVRLAYELGIPDRVIISHPVEDTRIPLATMEIFVAPALREGFGLAIVEAMAAGVPVVASNGGGPAEIIEDGKSGLLIPPGDPDSLERAIRDLLADPPRRSRIAEAGRQRARSQFDMERVVGEVEAVYSRAVDG